MMLSLNLGDSQDSPGGGGFGFEPESLAVSRRESFVGSTSAAVLQSDEASFSQVTPHLYIASQKEMNTYIRLGIMNLASHTGATLVTSVPASPDPAYISVPSAATSSASHPQHPTLDSQPPQQGGEWAPTSAQLAPGSPTYFLCCATESETPTPDFARSPMPELRTTAGEGRFRRIAFRDDSHRESLDTVIPAAVEFIHDSILQARTNGSGGVVVYCQYGKCRSPSMVVAYLMTYHQMTYDAAYDVIRRARAATDINISFATQLKRYGEGLLAATQHRPLTTSHPPSASENLPARPNHHRSPAVSFLGT